METGEGAKTFKSFDAGHGPITVSITESVTSGNYHATKVVTVKLGDCAIADLLTVVDSATAATSVVD